MQRRMFLTVLLAVFTAAVIYLGVGRSPSEPDVPPWIPPRANDVSKNVRFSEVIDANNRTKLLNRVRYDEAIPIDDRLLFARGMARVFLGDANDGKTVAQVINEQRTFERNQQHLAPAKPAKHPKAPR